MFWEGSSMEIPDTTGGLLLQEMAFLVLKLKQKSWVTAQSSEFFYWQPIMYKLALLLQMSSLEHNVSLSSNDWDYTAP